MAQLDPVPGESSDESPRGNGAGAEGEVHLPGRDVRGGTRRLQGLPLCDGEGGILPVVLRVRVPRTLPVSAGYR